VSAENTRAKVVCEMPNLESIYAGVSYIILVNIVGAQTFYWTRI
jgi:hypothetical protein